MPVVEFYEEKTLAEEEEFPEIGDILRACRKKRSAPDIEGNYDNDKNMPEPHQQEADYDYDGSQLHPYNFDGLQLPDGYYQREEIAAKIATNNAREREFSWDHFDNPHHFHDGDGDGEEEHNHEMVYSEDEHEGGDEEKGGDAGGNEEGGNKKSGNEESSNEENDEDAEREWQRRAKGKGKHKYKAKVHL